jgi:hypothetical protein
LFRRVYSRSKSTVQAEPRWGHGRRRAQAIGSSSPGRPAAATTPGTPSAVRLLLRGDHEATPHRTNIALSVGSAGALANTHYTFPDGKVVTVPARRHL